LISIKIALFNILKGILIGGGTLVPGVSGGTVAMLIGVFEEILESTANFFKHIRKSLYLLFPIFIGAVLGVFIISYPLEYFLAEFPKSSKFFFCIISLISSIYFARINLKGKKTFITIICFLCGILIAFFLSFLFHFCNINAIEYGYINLFFIGFSLSLALVLPAISFSYMLLFFGIYDSFINAINSLDVYFLIYIFLGIVIGTLIFAKLLLKLIDKHSTETYSFVFGFVLFSAIDIFI